MAIQDLDSLRDEVPDLFEGWDGPTEWEDEYIFWPIEKPESAKPSEDEILHIDTSDEMREPTLVSDNRFNTQNEAAAPRTHVDITGALG